MTFDSFICISSSASRINAWSRAASAVFAKLDRALAELKASLISSNMGIPLVDGDRDLHRNPKGIPTRFSPIQSNRTLSPCVSGGLPASFATGGLFYSIGRFVFHALNLPFFASKAPY